MNDSERNLAQTEGTNTVPSEPPSISDADKTIERSLDIFAVQSSEKWDTAKAKRWLATLAQINDREIAWWKLSQTVPKVVFIGTGMLTGGSSCTLLGWLLFGLFGRPGFGALFGLGVGLTGGLVLGLAPTELPRRFAPRALQRSEFIRELRFGVLGALVGGLVVGILYSGTFGILIGLIFGIAFGTVRRFTQPTGQGEGVTPASALRSDRLVVIYAAGYGALVGALVGAFMGGVVGATARKLVITIDYPILTGLLGGGVGALLGAFGLALVVHSTSASSRFTIARIWFALRRKTPLRLMTFLEGLRRCGIISQVGPYYQFRHTLFRD